MEPMTLEHLVCFVKAAFSIEKVKVFGEANKRLKRAAVSPGSGKSEIRHAIAKGADVLITGDIDHHDGIDAAACGLCIIDAGHYGLEHIFINYMEDYLRRCCEDVEIISQDIMFPYRIL